ncbi:MAG: tautomerase family protein [Desulfobulbus sp.]|jgi:4-oxalocrotonate tautomerase
MPYVNIRVAGNLSREQKAKIAEEVTDSLHRIAGKPKESVLIFIDEVSSENIAKQGKLIDGK